MPLSGPLHRLAPPAKLFVLCFTLSLCCGYFAGYKFLFHTTQFSATGIQEEYLGNEAQATEEAVIKFKKSENEVLTIVHTHVLSLSLVFFALGALILLTGLPGRWKAALVTEPFASLLLTFGGIWLMWAGVEWFKWVVMVSGILMTASVAAMAAVIAWQLYWGKDR